MQSLHSTFSLLFNQLPDINIKYLTYLIKLVLENKKIFIEKDFIPDSINQFLIYIVSTMWYSMLLKRRILSHHFSCSSFTSLSWSTSSFLLWRFTNSEGGALPPPGGLERQFTCNRVRLLLKFYIGTPACGNPPKNALLFKGTPINIGKEKKGTFLNSKITGHPARLYVHVPLHYAMLTVPPK